MHFKIIGPVTNVESIASGTALRERNRLWKVYGKGRWRKLKGAAKWNFKMVRHAAQKSTGMKHTA